MAVKPICTDYDKILKDLKRQLRLHGTLKEVAAQVGLNYRYLYDLLNGKHPLPLKLYVELVATFKLSFPSSLRTLQQRTFDRPVEILLDHREGSDLPASPFLDRLARRITILHHCEVDARTPGISVQSLIAEIEEQRYSDRISAQEGAQKLAHQVLKRLESIQGPKPANEVGELAAILALWATIQRMRGFRDLALKAFTFAFPLARHAADHWALGSCYQRAGYLLRDLDRPDLGCGFITEAIGHFSASRSQLDSWKCLMDRACMLSSNGNLQDSNAQYEASLLLLPGSEWRFRAGAFQGLGVNFQLQGRPEQARASLTAALAECRKADFVVGHIKWLSAKVEADLDQSEKALQQFHEATELLARYGNAADVALVCLDHAKQLLSLKQYPTLVRVVSGVGRWLPKLNANPILCRTFDKFVDLARAARVGLAELENARKDVTEAGRLGDRVLPS